MRLVLLVLVLVSETGTVGTGNSKTGTVGTGTS